MKTKLLLLLLLISSVTFAQRTLVNTYTAGDIGGTSRPNTSCYKDMSLTFPSGNWEVTNVKVEFKLWTNTSVGHWLNRNSTEIHCLNNNRKVSGGGATGYGQTANLGVNDSNLILDNEYVQGGTTYNFRMKMRLAWVDTACTTYYSNIMNRTWKITISYKQVSGIPRVYVDKNATGNNDGSSWANAYPSFQDALGSLGSTTTEIWIAKGTYTPSTTDRTKSFIFSQDINIYGGFAGTETSIAERDIVNNPTILSGDLNGDDAGAVSFSNTTKADNSYNIVKVGAEDVVLDGITIANGNGNGSTSALQEGSAVTVLPSVKKITLNNCTLTGNVVTRGGVVSAIDGAYGVAITFSNSTFKNNLAKFSTVLYSRPKFGKTLTFNSVNSLYANNTVDNVNGSGMFWFRNDYSCTINTSFTNDTFVNNTTNRTPTAGNDISVIDIGQTKGTLKINVDNTIFWNNTDANSTIVPAIGRNGNNAYPAVTNMLVNNSLDADGFSKVTYKQNIVLTDPLFTSATDFTLQTGSPAINAGDNAKIPADITTDLLGNQRIHNTTVDMGAYEFGTQLPQTNWTGATDTSWNTASNWSNGVPTTSLNAFVSNGATNYPVISNSANAKDITIENSASLTISPSANLTAENIITNDNLTIESDVNSYGSLKVTNSVTGKATYKSYVSDKWHLIGSPVVGQDVASFVTNSSLVSGTVNPNHKGLGIYENANAAPWTYYKNTLSWGNFDTAKAYAIKKTTAGTVDFTGTITTDNVQYTATGNANNTFEMISNPYTAYLNANSGANSILSENSSNLKSTNAALYFWNDTTKNYDVVNNTSSPSRLKPGQGFFVQMATTNGVVNFTPAMLLHQQSSSSRQAVQTSVALTISDEKSKGNTSKTTQIKYLSNTNDGLDVGYDAGYFDGGQSKVGVYTKLADGTYNDTDFMLQCVNKEKISGTIIPVGIKTSEAREVVFSAKAMNLPENLNVYLEDKETNKVTELSNGGEYKATVSEGSGRFYVHTKISSNLNADNIVDVATKLSVYKANNSLIINGLDEKATVILYNMIGKQVFMKKITTSMKTVSLPSLASGIYIVKVQSGATQISKKISIQ
ncbi:T9SS type A sorting domain-containing protein [Tenacibaculum piscium]|uniref:T9SS type A sorting domain-containing protein n=1 Tax=Tenacibaculum piscium TaxID=1458515 RepID=UPI00187B44AC|nr:T9SS type A sorting domain-containing protein [Tenacibaculum piscium]MBE7685102.1 T9SS type A sorting domain-containing protein [Tenacibaculum piscium]